MKEKKTKSEEKEFFDENPKKERKEKRDKSIISRVLNIVLWIILFAWMALVLTDYFKVRNEDDPMFCWFNNKTTSYENGTVKECTGLGYKVIKYNREDFKAIEFGPFWLTDRTAEK